MRLGEPFDAGVPGAAGALGWGTAGNRGFREPVTEAQVLDLSLTCTGLGPSLAVSRLSAVSRRSQGSLTPHVSGLFVSSNFRAALKGL